MSGNTSASTRLPIRMSKWPADIIQQSIIDRDKHQIQSKQREKRVVM